jgi:GT2 family glycosyltransferase
VTILFGVVTAFLLVRLAGIVVNLRSFPVLGENRRGKDLAGSLTERPEPLADERASVSILIPARNEARNLRAHLPGILRQPAREILILDDASDDGTADTVLRLAGQDPRVRLLTGAPLPPGWTGKNWACHQLAEAADGEVLLFTDADVGWNDGALEAFTQEMRRQRADAFSVFPCQRTGTLGERVLVPLIDDVLLSFLPFPLLRSQVPAAATANGQAIAFTRQAYDALGGHATMRDEIVEDVRFARQARRAGMQLGLALGGGLVHARMYTGYRDAVRGFAKSLPAAHGGSRLLLALGAAWHVLAYTVPLALVALEPRWLAPLLLAMAGRLLVNAKTGRRSYAEAILTPVTPLLALPVYARSMRRAVVWKGRAYT